MQDELTITIKRADFERIIDSAIEKSIGKFITRAEQPEKIFTAEEAARYLKIGVVTLWKKTQEGKIESEKKGRLNLYKKSFLDAYLASISPANTKKEVDV